jgi:IS30 family transposase
MKTRRHINTVDRYEIEILLDRGYSQADISRTLGFDESAISREINKRKTESGIYIAKVADHKARVKRSNSKHQGMKIEKFPEIKKRIIKELKEHRSPDEIAGRMKEDKITPTIGTNAIYKWLYSPFGQRYCKYLCTKRYRKKKQKKKIKREMIPNRIPLELRPELGIHTEFDTFVNRRRYQSKDCVCVLSDIESKLFVGKKMNDLKPDTMTKSLNEILREIQVDTLTGDNGIENRSHENYLVPAYFCEPHSPWQKPHVENSIGLLRKWFVPKQRNLKTLTQSELDRYTDILNRKYRKSLGYKSAYEVAYRRGIIDSIPQRNY